MFFNIEGGKNPEHDFIEIRNLCRKEIIWGNYLQYLRKGKLFLIQKKLNIKKKK